jgi:beta-glucanase (GH16 family)
MSSNLSEMRQHYGITMYLLGGLAFALVFAGQLRRIEANSPGPTPTPTQAATPTQWTLTWSDEFNGAGPLNGSDWIYDTGTGYAGAGCPANWGTGEVEVMSSSTDNVFQSNGNLNIRALHTGGSPTAGWTSGRIETVRTDFQPPAGGAMAVEARLQQPNVDTTNGLGYWPAFWMLGAPFRGNCPSWPSIGEIDVMEDINGRSSEFATLHCGSYPGGPCNEPTGLSSDERACPTCQTAFHTYRVELDKSVSPEEIRWYLDGTNFFTLSSNQVDATTWNNATNHGFFIILDMAIGGGFPAAFGGGPTAATISGQSLVVDYVRVFYSSTPMPTPTPTPIPPTVQFSLSSYSVGEGDGHVTITVTRTGDTSGAATVDYRTQDTDTFTVGCADTVNNLGSAYGRCDFATVVGTFSFAAGETMKTFAVPIIDDSRHEGNETFTVVLSSPTGATFGSPSAATVTIIDNDLVDGPNPILQTDDPGIAFFVRQHYLDFLGREPEAGEPWSAILRGCADQFNVDPNSPSAACDRITVSGAFFGSPEFKDKGFYVIDFYRVAFGRLPQYSEFVTDLASLVGTTAQEVFARRAAFADSFVQRPEFATIAAMSNSSYVMTLMSGTNGQNYNLTSITTPDPANPDSTTKVTLTTNDLINGLNANTLTKAQVLRAIVQSDEIINIEAVRTFVASQYYGYLRRTPDTAGFNSWVSYLTTHPTDFRTMVNGFMNSIEYRLRFGP